MPFGSYELRTTDPDDATAFYEDVLGPRGVGSMSVTRLPERALAAGAPAHWLGQVLVAHTAALVAKATQRGATQLGPPQTTSEGHVSAVLRDPFGAVFGLREGASPTGGTVAWHQLHTTDRDGAWSFYESLFGWTLDGMMTVGEHDHPCFAWQPNAPRMGSFADTARVPGIHPHWLFHFRVTDLDAAATKVRARGGRVLPVIPLPEGDRVAVCEDAQGAAFAIRATGAG